MFIYLFVLLLVCAPGLDHQKLPDLTHETEMKLRSRSPTYSLHAPDFGRAVILLAKDFKIPMSLEWIRSQQTQREVNLSWHDASLRQIVQRVVSDQPGYKVEVNEGIVRVFPVAEQGKDQDFLNLRIATFRVRNEVVEIASHKLRDSVRAPVSDDSQGRAGFAYSQATNIGDPAFTVSLQNLTVREILNRFITMSDRRIWVVTFTSTSQVTSRGYWPTATLWTDVGVQDSEQPIWDLLRWSDSIP